MIGYDEQDAPGFQTRHDRVARRDRRPAAALARGVSAGRPECQAVGWHHRCRHRRRAWLCVPYCKGVLHVWKQRKAYCDAVLTYDLRRGLDGLPTEALVDADARRMAQAQLAVLAAGRQKREARKAAKEAAAQVAARVDATPVVPPAPERRRPILTLASLRVGGHAAVG